MPWSHLATEARALTGGCLSANRPSPRALRAVSYVPSPGGCVQQHYRRSTVSSDPRLWHAQAIGATLPLERRLVAQYVRLPLTESEVHLCCHRSSSAFPKPGRRSTSVRVPVTGASRLLPWFDSGPPLSLCDGQYQRARRRCLWADHESRGTGIEVGLKWLEAQG
jgi:hypothetical protein